MKLTLCVALLVVLGLLPHIRADCCKPSKIIYKLKSTAKGLDCGSFGGKYHNHETCEKKICGNGDGVVGTWCGRGKCNPFGCHCKRGCLPGEPIQSFREKHGAFNFEFVSYA
ncbi:protein Diedel-like [Drosophila busckii]|uniref:protein Diedel-like n=1 Tax=Drosophila busckii TaxID=30019 RepID=UPI00083E9FCE|nr:protein Diedel-like [Drosophila busckii]